MQLSRGVERRFADPIRHQLDADEKPAASDVADERVVVQRVAEAAPQLLAARANVFEQTLLFDGLLHGERRGAGDGVADIGVAVLEEA